MTRSHGYCFAFGWLEISATFDTIDSSLIKPCSFLTFLDAKMSLFYSYFSECFFSSSFNNFFPLTLIGKYCCLPGCYPQSSVFHLLSLDLRHESHCFYHYLAMMCLCLKSVSPGQIPLSGCPIRSVCAEQNSYFSSTYSFLYITHPNA